MIKIVKILIILSLLLSGCSEKENDYYKKIQADWKNSDGSVISFYDTLYNKGWISFGSDIFEIIGDTLRLYHGYSKNSTSFAIRKLTETSLWLREINNTTKDSLLVYRKIEPYSDNIDLKKIELRYDPLGDNILGYRVLLIEEKKIYLEVRGRGKNNPKQFHR